MNLVHVLQGRTDKLLYTSEEVLYCLNIGVFEDHAQQQNLLRCCVLRIVEHCLCHGISKIRVAKYCQVMPPSDAVLPPNNSSLVWCEPQPRFLSISRLLCWLVYTLCLSHSFSILILVFYVSYHCLLFSLFCLAISLRPLICPAHPSLLRTNFLFRCLNCIPTSTCTSDSRIDTCVTKKNAYKMWFNNTRDEENMRRNDRRFYNMQWSWKC